jgi:hypothetical protein
MFFPGLNLAAITSSLGCSQQEGNNRRDDKRSYQYRFADRPLHAYLRLSEGLFRAMPEPNWSGRLLYGEILVVSLWRKTCQI